MDAADVFRQGLGAAFQQPQYFYPNRPPVPVLGAPTPQASAQWDNQENEAPHRIAHTLTACCRCRQVSRPPFVGKPLGLQNSMPLLRLGPLTQLPEPVHSTSMPQA